MAGYNRIYINLMEESKRYSLDNKKVYGKCILEEKNNDGKVVISVENLKPNNYDAYLLVNQHGQYVAVPLEKLNNKLEVKKQLKNGYISNTKFLLKDVLAVMIGITENAKVIPVLIGYKKDKINYKGNFYVYNKNINSKNKKTENKNNQVTVKYKEEKKINNTKLEDKPTNITNTTNNDIQIEKIKEDKNKNSTVLPKKILNNSTKNTDDNANADADDFFQELFSNNEDSDENIFSNMITRFKEELDEIKYISEVSNNEFAKINTTLLHIDLINNNGDLKYIFEHNNKITPFIKQNKDVSWVTIDLKELTVVDNKCWELRRNPFVMQGYATYGHLILGKYKKEENNCYLIGIPSQYDANSINIAKKMGVIQYKPCDNLSLSNSVPGYWIILKN